jgi:hypothetical protein
MTWLWRGLIIALCGGSLLAAWSLTKQGAGVPPLRDGDLYTQMRQECDEDERLPNGDCPPRTYRSYFFVRRYTGGPGIGK